MKIYMLRSDTANFASIVPDNDDDWDKLGVLDEGVSVKNWLPIKMQWINENEGSNDLPHGDFPSLATNIPVFSARACEILNKHFSLNDYGQFLEVNIEGETYYLFNVTCLRNNIIDEKKSIILRYSNSEEISDIKSYSFIQTRLHKEIIFKIAEAPVLDVFVSDDFRMAVESNILTGFIFKECGLSTSI